MSVEIKSSGQYFHSAYQPDCPHLQQTNQGCEDLEKNLELQNRIITIRYRFIGAAIVIPALIATGIAWYYANSTLPRTIFFSIAGTALMYCIYSGLREKFGKKKDYSHQEQHSETPIPTPVASSHDVQSKATDKKRGVETRKRERKKQKKTMETKQKKVPIFQSD